MARFIEKHKVDEYLTKIRQGESSALEALYDITSKKLYAMCYTYLHSHHDSEDALSDTYVAIVKSIDMYNGKNGFSWMYTIAKHICLNMLRRGSRSVSVDFDDEETVNTLHLSTQGDPKCFDESGIIALARRVLNQNELQIVILHAINELKFKEIAKIIDSKESTVRWQYNNAIKKVRESYEGVR